jgi:hypothetical protein
MHGKKVNRTDTVESPPIAPAVGFIGGGDRSEGQRLVNVAVTRPQHKLFIIANAGYIAAKFANNDTLRLAVDEASASAVISSREVLGSLADVIQPLQVTLSRTVVSGASVSSAPAEFDALNEETFFDRFFADVRTAQSSIVIMGPFVRNWRTSNVASELRSKSLAGVKVTVVATEDRAGTPVDNAARKALEDAGINFRTSPGMHEKIVFIDDAIVYWGSLNPLSHSGTTEFMARIVSQAIAKEVAKTVNASVRADHKQWGEDIIIFLDDIPPDAGACPKCGGTLRRRPSKYGPFYGCSNYRRDSPSSCDYTQDVTEEALMQAHSLANIPCDKCNAGLLRPRTQRKDLWMECAAASPCGHRRKIVVQ